MSLLAIFKSAGPTGFGYGSTAEQVTEGLSLAGQTILVTGCNSGIGQETCRVLALRGALGAWDGAHQRRRLRLRARRFPARRSATPASFQILRLCESAEAREYFPTCAHKYFKNATRLAAIRAISIPLRAGI